MNNMTSRVRRLPKKPDKLLGITFTENCENLSCEPILLSKSKKVPSSVLQKKKLKNEQKLDDEYENIDDKNKDIIDKNNDTKQRLIAVEKIIEEYPALKKDKKRLIDIVLDRHVAKVSEYVLEKINLNGKIFFKDMKGNIIDDNIRKRIAFIITGFLSSFRIFTRSRINLSLM
jgi:hypothetical protein